MIKYAKIINEETGLCEVGIGTNNAFYQSIGMVELNVIQSDIDGAWYLADKCPMKTDEQKAQEEAERIKELSMTRSDFFDATIKAFGADQKDFFPIIETILSQIPDTVQLIEGIPNDRAKKIAINNYENAQRFYRKHLLFDILTNNPIQLSDSEAITITSEQWDNFFDETNKGNVDAYKELLY